MSTLLQAARQDRWDLVLRNLMLDPPEAAAIANERDYINGQTVVHLAAVAERLDVLRRIKQLGVRMRDCVNFGNRNPLEEAQVAGASKAVQWLLQNEYSSSEQLYYSGDFSFLMLTRLFNERDAAIDAPIRAYNDRTCAAICVEELRFPELVWLAVHDADLKVVDQGRSSLLHLVALPKRKGGPHTSCLYDVETGDGDESDDGDGDDGAIVIGTPAGGSESPVESSDEWRRFEPQYVSHLTQVDAILRRCDSLSFPDDLTVSELAALRITAFLCKSGVDIDAFNADHATPALSMAERSSRNPELAWAALQVLKLFGANLCLQDSEGLDVSLRFAAECGGGPWLLWLFTKGGCRLNVMDRKGKTLEDYLAERDAPQLAAVHERDALLG